ncbi:MAG: hypothetical protein GY765_40355 [bacterium]|nr:hypothetical protein [bacterium]
MSKIDFKRTLKEFYRPSAKKFSIVDVPSMQFLMVNGRGDPNTAQEYRDAVQALYPAAFTLKFMSKLELGKDYVVPPLEGLWWAEDMETFAVTDDKSDWIWTAMIMQPDWITAEMLETAVQKAKKKNGDLPGFAKLRLDSYHEGLAAQIMYTGAYADEGPTIARLHAFIEENGYELSGKHHEIYLSDPRRTAPEKLKTVIRQPMH